MIKNKWKWGNHNIIKDSTIAGNKSIQVSESGVLVDGARVVCDKCENNATHLIKNDWLCAECYQQK